MESVPQVFARTLRSTMLTALVLGACGVLVSALIAPVLATVGLVLGLGLAYGNYRLLDAGVARAEAEGDEASGVLRRAIAARTFVRLGVITAVVVGLMLLDAPLGVGAVAGLVVFQISFVFNAGRAVAAGLR